MTFRWWNERRSGEHGEALFSCASRFGEVGSMPSSARECSMALIQRGYGGGRYWLVLVSAEIETGEHSHCIQSSRRLEWKSMRRFSTAS